MSLSSREDIKLNVNRSTNGYEFADTVGSMIVNNEYSIGYKEFKKGFYNSKTYYFHALSAIGQDTCETIYNNVVNYIDYVCNIDLCKIKSLNNLTQMQGIKYSILDAYNDMPLEIRNFIDILSINRRYLFDSSYIKDTCLLELSNYIRDTLPKDWDAIISGHMPSEAKKPGTQLNKSFKYAADYIDFAISTDLVNCKQYSGRYELYIDGPFDLSTINDDGKLSSELDPDSEMPTYGINEYNSFPITFVDDSEPLVILCNRLYVKPGTNFAIAYYSHIAEPKETKLGLFRLVERINKKYPDFNIAELTEANILVLHDGAILDFKFPSDDFQLTCDISANSYNSDTTDVNMRSYAFKFNVVSEDEEGLDNEILDKLEGTFSININGLKCNINDLNDVKQDISENHISSFIHAVYENFISSTIFMPYNLYGNTNSIIYCNPTISAIVLSGALATTTRYTEYKLKHNIPLAFNVESIATDIIDGADQLTNYLGYELSILSSELQYRQANILCSNIIDKTNILYDELNQTRYSYYRELKVIEYIKFIQDKLTITNLSDLNIYNIDHNYMVLDDSSVIRTPFINKDNWGKFDEDGKALEWYNYGLIKNAADILTKITLYIANLRNKLKTQSRKIYMKGTFNLLSYVINEYLTNIPANTDIANYVDRLSDDVALTQYYKDLSKALTQHRPNDVGIIEYDDLTEYYNLSSEVDNEFKNVNQPFWLDGFQDKYSFAQADIDNFYLSVLNLGDTISSSTQLKEFLATIYSVGNTSVDFDGVLSDILMNYGGMSACYVPYFNHKNINHPTYQLHPYLWNFIEHNSLLTTIINAFTSPTLKMLEDAQVAQVLPTIIGKFGLIIDIWKDYNVDFSGYSSRYEMSNNKPSGSTTISPLVDYDGLFYPPALDEFIRRYKDNLLQQMCDEVSNMISGDTFYTKYYQHLNLVKADYINIANRLSTYAEVICTHFATKNNESDAADIYKYGLDQYNNSYILTKKYSQAKPTLLDKANTKGTLWIRLNSHPIAFPAIDGTYPLALADDAYMNGRLKAVAISADDYMSIGNIVDIEIANDGQTLVPFIFNTHTLNENYVERYAKVFERQEFKIPLICDIHYETISDGSYVLKLDKDRKNDVECILPLLQYNLNTIVNRLQSTESANDDIPVMTYLGLTNENDVICGIFLNSILVPHDETDDTDDVDKIFNIKLADSISHAYTTVNFEFVTYKKNYSVKAIQHNNYIASFGKKLPDDTCFKFSYYDGLYSFAYINSLNNKTYNTYYHHSNLSCEISVDAGLASYDLIADCDKSSADKFEDNIELADFRITDGEMRLVNQAQYNLLADMSYIPLFPSLSGHIPLFDATSKKYKQNQTYSLQLLGQSIDNMDDIIDTVKAQLGNDDGTYNDIQSIVTNFDTLYSQLIGRIYEDAEINWQKFVVYLKNEWLRSSNSDGDCLVWQISYEKLSHQFIDNSDIILYNIKSNGKYPYYIGQIKDITGETATAGILSTAITNYIQTSAHLDYVDYYNTRVALNGTYNAFKRNETYSDSNHLHGISSMILLLDKANYSLSVVFNKQDNGEQYHTINSDTIAAIIYNKSDISLYERYHMLDNADYYNLNSRPPAGEYTPLYELRTVVEGIGANATLTTDGMNIKLNEIDLTQYSALSDVPGLKGKEKNLKIKVSEEDVYNNPKHPNYYFPGWNDKYPTTICDIIKNNLLIMNAADSLFTDTNTFVVKMDSISIFDDVGVVGINIYDDNENIRVYEDYLSTYHSWISSDMYPYDDSDSRILNYTHMYTLAPENETSQTAEEYINDKAYDLSILANTPQVLSDDMQLGDIYKLQVASTEDDIKPQLVYNYQILSADGAILSNDIFDKSHNLNIYVNYRKDESGNIILYFNYINFINTPFIDYDDVNKSYKPTIIPNTYLRLDNKSSEGILDIVVQYKSLINNKLQGLKTALLASYKIYNVSDDKPKFLIQKIYQANNGAFRYVAHDPHVMVSITSAELLTNMYDVLNNNNLSAELLVDISSNTTIKELSVEFGMSDPHMQFMTFDNNNLLLTSTLSIATKFASSFPISVYLAHNNILSVVRLKEPIYIDVQNALVYDVDDNEVQVLDNSGMLLITYRNAFLTTTDNKYISVNTNSNSNNSNIIRLD